MVIISFSIIIENVVNTLRLTGTKPLVLRKRSIGLFLKVPSLIFFFVSILDYLLLFQEKTPCHTIEYYVSFSYSDTILSLFKSQEEAFGAPVQKMNLRGRKTKSKR